MTIHARTDTKAAAGDLNPGPRPYQGRALPLSYSSRIRSIGLVPYAMERVKGIEPSSTCLEGRSSTIELHPQSQDGLIDHRSCVSTWQVGREGFEPP